MLVILSYFIRDDKNFTLFHEVLYNFSKLFENLHIKIYELLGKSINIHKTLQKSMKIYKKFYTNL